MATFLNVFSAEGAHIMGGASPSGAGIHTPVSYVVPPSPIYLGNWDRWRKIPLEYDFQGLQELRRMGIRRETAKAINK